MEPLPPRLFWRRLAALVVDFLLASSLSLLILLPFTGDTDRLRLSGPFYVHQCGAVTSITEEAAAIIAPDLPVAALACQQHVFGIDNGLTLRLLYDVVKTETTQSSRNVSFAVSAEGKPVQPLAPQGILNALLLVLTGGWMLGRWRQTPGKWLLGVKTARDGRSPYLREALRLLPVVLASAVPLVMALAGTNTLNALSQMPTARLIAVAAAGLILFLGYYLVPLLRWRGSMPWDRWTGRGPVTRA